ncbi:ADP-ribosylglycohydrolase family protein [Telmatocola sphagniphila]|uniref:ADP-ribosylglycohydrolase family protein n=1 Tax=Telmatocola sphagniphila TaxID=1123043 RepID=A0A8E6BAJ9_9BACT|nr:ADP-ribosylglycohydrolase family protein [Telmatocola sphagniphila]QVL34801.1 ADP-ribosylglycohydrolase family protein [Telmatocola sphagniphila]
MPSDSRAIIGCLLGTAAGDSLGLPYEGLTPQRAARILGVPLRQRFLFGYGMVSDDTDHTCLVAESLLLSQQNPELFLRLLSRRLRFWLLSLPAGVGKATALALFKSWLGFGVKTSGVYSAGNGPAMRSAILGVLLSDKQQLAEFVRLSTRITHTDPKAEWGALAIALAARQSADLQCDGRLLLNDLKALTGGSEAEELLTSLQQVIDSVGLGEKTERFAHSENLSAGITGYMYHTVPMVLHVWLSHPTDYRRAIQEIILLGGDADSTAAILGGIIGARVGKDGIPREWLKILAWPRDLAWMEKLGEELANKADSKITARRSFSVLATLPRNLIFLAVVLVHIFRRCLPPY